LLGISIITCASTSCCGRDILELAGSSRWKLSLQEAFNPFNNICRRWLLGKAGCCEAGAT
jgi:hypothetical protein